MTRLSCGFIGLGLIGGSIAKALRAAHPDIHLKAYNPHLEKVDQAIADGIIDEKVNEIGKGFEDCDYIFLCAPVAHNNTNLEKLAPYLSKKTTVTDIGSVKTSIHEVVHRLGLDNQFIGGHPMAGTERIGYANSKAGILENAYYILTKTEQTEEDRLNRYYELVKSIGVIPLVVTYQQHDYITGAISHVPHVVSASLVNLVHDNDSPQQLMKMIAAGGFKDITRISSSSPVMWQQICLTNSANISDLLGKYISSLESIRAAIISKDSDKIMDFFASARQYRESFIDASSGPIKKLYEIHVDIADKPGNIAAVATLLSDKNINIKNIGIVHNREYERGSLHIELNDDESRENAINILKTNGYNTID
ncbi:MAG: prephenate dehydrogenase [Butyrivibrio sp.]|nr:prephenate dehydrogenase [Butyrivibrio sp.]